MKSHWIVFAEVMVFFIIYGDAQVTLSRSTTVMIIEDSVSLTCHLDNSLTWNAASLRSFSGPPGFRSLITSGTTVDANKYEETIKASEKTFTMQIKNFSYTDLGDYRCTYLFDTSSTLTLAANEFLEDTPENVKKDENLEADGTTTLKYTLYQVRPQPNITVTVNDNPPPSSDISIKEQMIPNLDNNNYTYDAEFTVEISALKGTDVVKVLIQAGEYTYNRTISIPDLILILIALAFLLLDLIFSIVYTLIECVKKVRAELEGCVKCCCSEICVERCCCNNSCLTRDTNFTCRFGIRLLLAYLFIFIEFIVVMVLAFTIYAAAMVEIGIGLGVGIVVAAISAIVKVCLLCKCCRCLHEDVKGGENKTIEKNGDNATPLQNKP